MTNFIRKDNVIISHITKNPVTGAITPVPMEHKAYVEWGSFLVHDKTGQEWRGQAYLDISSETPIALDDRVTKITHRDGRIFEGSWVIKKIDYTSVLGTVRQEVYI